jgi:hypothetical protein
VADVADPEAEGWASGDATADMNRTAAMIWRTQ